MPLPPRVVEEAPGGDIGTALLLVKGLNGLTSAEEDEQVESLRDELAADDKVEVLRGFGTLIVAWMSLINGDHLLIAKAVVQKLLNYEDVQAEHLPTLAGVLFAAALGQSPMNWRARIGGPISNDEALGWAYAAWLFADFTDSAMNRPGASIDLVESLFDIEPPE